MNDDGECSDQSICPKGNVLATTNYGSYKKSSFRLPRQTEQAYFTYYAVTIFSVLDLANFQTHTH